MPAGALIDTGNRSLGGSMGDFSLYGTLPAAIIGAPQPATPGGSYVTVPSATPAPEPAPNTGGGDEAAPISTLSALAAEPMPADTAAPAPAAPAIGTPDAPATPAPLPAPTGSGSLAPIEITTPLGAQADAAAAGLGLASLSAPVIEAPALPPASAVDVSGVLSGGTLAPVFAAPLVEPALATVAGTLEAAPIVAVLTEATAPLADGTAVELLGDTLAAQAIPVTEALGAITDFAGADPIAGVSTLVDMVETAESFAFTDVAPTAPIATGGSIVDALALDAAPPALIGVAAEAEEAASGLIPRLPQDDENPLSGL